VVAAAVILPARLALRVRIDDSKRLTALQRREAFPAILRHAAVGIGIVPSGAIDRENVLEASLCAMAEAVAELAPQPELVLVDGNRAPRISVPCWPIVGGDRNSLTIACASIVAKVIRDSLMTFYHNLFPAYRFDHHKGYGTALHFRMLMRHGPSVLHRFSFAPVSRVAGMAWPFPWRKTPQDHGSVSLERKVACQHPELV